MHDPPARPALHFYIYDHHATPASQARPAPLYTRTSTVHYTEHLPNLPNIHRTPYYPHAQEDKKKKRRITEVVQGTRTLRIIGVGVGSPIGLGILYKVSRHPPKKDSTLVFAYRKRLKIRPKQP